MIVGWIVSWIIIVVGGFMDDKLDKGYKVWFDFRFSGIDVVDWFIFFYLGECIVIFVELYVYL